MTRVGRVQQSPMIGDYRSHPFKHKTNALSISVCFLASMVLLSFLLTGSFVLDKRRSSLRPEGPEMAFSRKELIGTKEALTCQDARSLVAQGMWKDPNHGRLYYRRNLVTEPSFAVSLHTKSYDPVRWEHIYLNGKYYEDQVQARFLKILRRTAVEGEASRETNESSEASGLPTSLVVDVGANIGYYTLLSMALGYSVVAFEINPPNILRMCESLELNQWLLPENDKGFEDPNKPTVRFYQQGVSDVNGQEFKVWVPKNPGQAFLRTEQEGTEEMEEHASMEGADHMSGHHDSTTTVTLDHFAQQHGWLIPLQDGSLGVNPNIAIKILKVDVEGKEPLVIEGTQTLLRSGIVENILIEFRRLGRPNVQQAMLILLDSGYTLVDDTEGKVSITRSMEILSDLTDQLEGTTKTIDLWFQRV